MILETVILVNDIGLQVVIWCLSLLEIRVYWVIDAASFFDRKCRSSIILLTSRTWLILLWCLHRQVSASSWASSFLNISDLIFGNWHSILRRILGRSSSWFIDRWLTCFVGVNFILLRHTWLSYFAAVMSICLPLPSSFGLASTIEVGLLEWDAIWNATFSFWFSVKVGVREEVVRENSLKEPVGVTGSLSFQPNIKAS